MRGCVALIDYRYRRFDHLALSFIAIIKANPIHDKARREPPLVAFSASSRVLTQPVRRPINRTRSSCFCTTVPSFATRQVLIVQTLIASRKIRRRAKFHVTVCVLSVLAALSHRAKTRIVLCIVSNKTQ